MYLPASFYERAPYFWLILGVLLIILGSYLGSRLDPVFLYMGLGGGAIACVWGFRVFSRRLMRENRRPAETYDDYLDQTMELNLDKVRRQDESA